MVLLPDKLPFAMPGSSFQPSVLFDSGILLHFNGSGDSLQEETFESQQFNSISVSSLVSYMLYGAILVQRREGPGIDSANMLGYFSHGFHPPLLDSFFLNNCICMQIGDVVVQKQEDKASS